MATLTTKMNDMLSANGVNLVQAKADVVAKFRSML